MTNLEARIIVFCGAFLVAELTITVALCVFHTHRRMDAFSKRLDALSRRLDLARDDLGTLSKRMNLLRDGLGSLPKGTEECK